MKIGDLTYSLGAEWDKDSLDSIKDGFTNVSKSFMTAVGIASTALAGTFAVVKEFAGANDELGKLARNKDIAIDSLQAMQYSFEGAGIAGSKVGDVLDKLQEQKEGFRKGTADYEAFAQIGVNPQAHKNNEEYFNAVLDGLGKVKDEATKSDLAKRLLGSADMKNLIDGGSEAIRQQKKELEEMGILLSKQDTKTSANFNDTLLATTTILSGLINKIMISLMPIFTNLMTKFNDFMKKNKKSFSGIMEFFKNMVNGIVLFLSLIGRVVNHLGGVKVVLTGIVAIITALNYKLMLTYAPILLITAGVIALMVLFDDLVSFFNGEDSLIADWLGIADINEFKSSFPNLSEMFKIQFDSIKAIFTFFKDSVFNIWDMITGKISFTQFLTAQIDVVTNLLNSLKNIFFDFVDWLLGLFSKIDLFGGVGKQIDNIGNKISSFMGFGGDEKAQAPTNPTMVDSSSTSSSTTSNIYHISANVDAKSKSISEAITEISNPSGY